MAERVVVMSAVSHLVVGLVVMLWFGLAVAGPCLAAGAEPAAEPGHPLAPGDAHTLGNPDQVRVTHLDLDLTVHFDRKELAGVATLDVERQPGVEGRGTAPARHPWADDRERGDPLVEVRPAQAVRAGRVPARTGRSRSWARG